MPRKNLILQVFVASPSDVEEERGVLDSVVAELNRTWANSIGVSFEVLKWETSVRPGFSDDAQAVINSQIPDDYDVFIGIFWSRLGTRTSRAASGTVEEFERAYQRFRETGSVPEIMLYFKEAPLSPSRIEAGQLLALQEFKSSLPEKGGLYSSFEDLAGFEASLRAHLAAIAQQFVKVPERSISLESAELLPEALIADEEDGLFDCLEIYTMRTQDMTAAMEVISDATVRIGEQLSQRTIEINARDASDPGHAKRLVKRASEDMFRYASILEASIPLLSSARQEAFAALSSAVVLMEDFKSDKLQLHSLRKTLLRTIEGAVTAKSGLLGMRQAAAGLPRVSKDLNKSKRAVTDNLDRLLSEIESTESTVANLVEAIDRLLASSTAGQVWNQ
ncbi:hypothetical protein [Uliginosibacterium sp. H1]|uniref:hypothetical protein n=1 Tax=Uliginosibacterium sp. H1 TaxID=3114757 RepID=UPI002E199FF0|nr:hypothetical protein [Uliginosibacterium sp. H1]